MSNVVKNYYSILEVVGSQKAVCELFSTRFSEENYNWETLNALLKYCELLNIESVIKYF